MATIRKRGNSQWEARIRKRGYLTTCKTFKTRLDAEIWSKEVETAMYKNQFVSTKEAEQYTLSECLDRYIEEYTPRLKHQKREVNRARFLKKYKIASRIMATIRSKDIADYRKEREAEGVGGNTIYLEFALLSSLFNYARSDWGMEGLQNPVKLAAKPKLSKGRERRLEEGEEKLLLSNSSENFKQVILFALETAMRREEIATLEWKNVNIEKRYAYLQETKNGENRTIPLSVKALKILKEIKENHKNYMNLFNQQLVFGMSVNQITHNMKKACKDAGIEDLHFHDLRHEATSRFFENTDLDLMEIKTITGHKTLQMLVRYTHLRTARLADRLAGARRVSA